MARKAQTTARKARVLIGLTLILAGFSSLIVLFVAGFGLAALRKERLEIEERALESLSETLAAQAGGMFEEVELLLKVSNIWLASHPGADPRSSAEFSLYADAIASYSKGLFDLAVVTRKGELYPVPSRGRGAERIVLGRRYFSDQLDPKSWGLHIGPSVRDGGHGLAIPVSYPVSRDSELAAIVVFVRLSGLDALYRRFLPSSGGTITLFNAEGIILARSPLEEGLVGLRYGESNAWERGWRGMAREARATVAILAGIGGEPRVAAYRPVGGLKLIISVSSRLSDVLAFWRMAIPIVLVWACLVIACIVLIALRLLRILSELGEVRRGLEVSVARLEESQAAKDKLFSIVSHDLRGPIGGMRSLLETLAAEHGTMSEEDLDEGLRALEAAAGNTYSLLDDLLAWSRSQSGTIRFAPRRIPLSSAAEDAVQAVSGQAAAKGVSIEAAVGPGSFVYADPEMLATVLRNLLSNAVKYSRAGGSVWLRSAEAEGGSLVSVEDEGEGIEADTLGKLFKIGAVHSRPGTAGERGTGLGLAVCKEFMDRHGGRISASSEPGKGSRFELFFPAERKR